MATLDWSQCSAVETVPGRLSGAWKPGRPRPRRRPQAKRIPYRRSEKRVSRSLRHRISHPHGALDRSSDSYPKVTPRRTGTGGSAESAILTLWRRLYFG